MKPMKAEKLQEFSSFGLVPQSQFIEIQRMILHVASGDGLIQLQKLKNDEKIHEGMASINNDV